MYSMSSSAFFLENDKICKLKSNYNMLEFYNLDNSKYFYCYRSMPNCKECSSVSKCTKCNSGYILVDNNKCLTSNSTNNEQYIYIKMVYIIPVHIQCQIVKDVIIILIVKNVMEKLFLFLIL